MKSYDCFKIKTNKQQMCSLSPGVSNSNVAYIHMNTECYATLNTKLFMIEATDNLKN